MLTECTQSREAVVRCSQVVASALPLGPSPKLTMAFPELRSQWHDVARDAAQLIADTAGNDVGLLRSAIGPALEVGIDPQWRLLLKVALMLAEQHDHTLPDVGLAGELRSWLDGTNSPGTPTPMASALPSGESTASYPFRFRASIQ